MLKIWDKQEPIKGVSAEDYMKGNPLTIGDVLLIVNDTTGIIEQVISVDVLRGNLNLDSSLTPMQVGEAYLKVIEDSKQIEISNTEKIAILEKEKSDLQTALAENIEQQAKDKLELQTSMAELIENMNVGGTV